MNRDGSNTDPCGTPDFTPTYSDISPSTTTACDLLEAIIPEADQLKLQEDLSKLVIWEQTWKMVDHPEKRNVLTISKKIKPIKQEYTCKRSGVQDQILDDFSTSVSVSA
jgi:hypothetical protein